MLRVEALRADAWFQLGDPTRAVELMLQRETWLDDRQSIDRNRERLWQGLLVSDPHVLRAATEESTDPVVRWLVRCWARSPRRPVSRVSAGETAIVRWREQYADASRR